MHIDTVTLMIAGSVTAVMSGLWLAASSLQRRDGPLAWWGTANFCYGAAIGLLAIGLSRGALPAVLGGLLLSNIAPALIWGGALVFVGRRVPVLLLLAGTATWLATSALTFDYGANTFAPAISFVAWVVYMAAAAFALWRGRDEALPARWPLVAILLIHGSVYLGGLHDVLTGSFARDGIPSLDSWFGAIHFEGLLFAMGTAVFMTMLSSERREARYRQAANVDPLTGTANRNGFFDHAGRMLMRCRAEGEPLSLIIFDLDHFKTINDSYGHQAGDRVLCTFADTVRAVLRPNDLFGRHGGEEFAVVLPNEPCDTAFAVAERVRRTFAEASRTGDDGILRATVSAGVAAADETMSFDDLMLVTDRALYRAKQSGRNCVRRADGPPNSNGDGVTVIRVA